MPIRKKRIRITFSLAIKQGRRFKPIPRFSFKQRRDILLGKKKLPALFAVRKKGGKVIESMKVD